MSKIGDNNPPVQIEVSRDLAVFLIANCDINILFALGNLQNVSRETAEKLVSNIENFKALKQATEKALKD